jgi:hypothetical protein
MPSTASPQGATTRAEDVILDLDDLSTDVLTVQGNPQSIESKARLRELSLRRNSTA